MATDYQAQDDAWGKQYDEQQAAAKQQEQTAAQPPTFLQKWVTGPIGRVTTSVIDGALASAEDPEFSAPMRAARDATAGAVTGATNIADAAGGATKSVLSNTMGPDVAATLSAASPIWEHAKQHILDFRDAIAVKDPSLTDSVIQGVAQLAVPFAGYSRALSMFHGAANMFAAGAVTDATALAPHDMRMADLFALGRHTEGKLGEALNALSPDGSALNAYVNYLADRGNESEAEGRFKNVIDGFGVNMITTPLMAAAAGILKHGVRGVKYAMDNGIRNTLSDMAPAPKLGPASQVGAVGDLTPAAPYVDPPMVQALRRHYDALAKVPLDYRTTQQTKMMSDLMTKISDQYGHENAMRNGETLGEVKARVAKIESTVPKVEK